MIYELLKPIEILLKRLTITWPIHEKRSLSWSQPGVASAVTTALDRVLDSSRTYAVGRVWNLT